MQEKGFDTVDANRQLGLPDDAREYTSVKNILSELNISSIKLIVRPPRPSLPVAVLAVHAARCARCVRSALPAAPQQPFASSETRPPTHLTPREPCNRGRSFPRSMRCWAAVADHAPPSCGARLT